MALPTSRNTTYAIGAQVKSDDLNDLQDCAIGKKHGDVPLHLHPNDFRGAAAYGGDYVEIAGSGAIRLAIPVELGDRLKSITIAREGPAGGTHDMVVALRKSAADGTGADVFSTADDNLANAFADRTFDIDPDVVVAAGEVFSLSITTPAQASNIKIGAVRVLRDRPLS